jgi:hypothetical protein
MLVSFLLNAVHSADDLIRQCYRKQVTLLNSFTSSAMREPSMDAALVVIYTSTHAAI